ncbi:hypothetical protein EMJ08_22470 [Escherichia coli]|nr:hypothetical protein [Escherichia coli]STM95830.1 Uncharacterised protein [Escherichia coli]
MPGMHGGGAAEDERQEKALHGSGDLQEMYSASYLLSVYKGMRDRNKDVRTNRFSQKDAFLSHIQNTDYCFLHWCSRQFFQSMTLTDI